MKKALTLVLTVTLLCLFGCQKASNLPGNENSGAPPSEPTYESSGAAYIQKYAELVNQYGEAGVVEDTITEYQQYSYLEGVCVAELFDFNGDGTLDLFVIYSNGQYTGKHISNEEEYDIVIPQANSYEIEIWTFKDGELIQLLHQPSVGSYRSFDTEYWDTDNCMVTVYQKPDGLPVIQLYTTSKEGLAYTNISWGGTGVVTDELYYHKDSFTLNGESIPEEIWNEHITDYNTILYFARLSNPDWIVDYSDVLDRTKEVVQALSRGEYAQIVPVQAEYISFYLREIDRSNRERLDQLNAFPTKYSLYDIDQNDTLELLIKNGNCEADYFYDVFTVLDGELVHCGEFGGGHTGLYTGRQAGLVRYEGHMMAYTIAFITLEDMELKIEVIVDYMEIEQWEESYPELSEFGYGAYDQSLPGCYVTTPSELYMYGVSPIPASPAPTLLTADEARAICIAWLDNKADLPLYTLIEWEDGLYPEYDFFGELYYCFAVDGMSVFWFRILVHIETGETLFMTRTNEDHPNTVVGLLDDWPDWEDTAYAQALLTVDDAIVVYDSWLEDHADLSSYTLNRQSYEQFELLGEPYYLFHAEEMSMYWYNILVQMETGGLLFMMTPDGQYPVKSIELLDDWYDSIYAP